MKLQTEVQASLGRGLALGNSYRVVPHSGMGTWLCPPDQLVTGTGKGAYSWVRKLPPMGSSIPRVGLSYEHQRSTLLASERVSTFLKRKGDRGLCTASQGSLVLQDRPVFGTFHHMIFLKVDVNTCIALLFRRKPSAPTLLQHLPNL